MFGVFAAFFWGFLIGDITFYSLYASNVTKFDFKIGINNNLK